MEKETYEQPEDCSVCTEDRALLAEEQQREEAIHDEIVTLQATVDSLQRQLELYEDEITDLLAKGSELERSIARRRERLATADSQHSHYDE